ncbi:MAG: tetratricopeptide repeat protein, partial [Sandaracinaceae bacterium]|nr:tetratricopeptide repeat protein [Sandaracinaceae bacterium]
MHSSSDSRGHAGSVAARRARAPLRHATLLSVCTALMGLTCHAEANPPPTSTGAPVEALHAEPELADASVALPSEGVLAMRRAALTGDGAEVVARADRAAEQSTGDDASLYRWVAASLDPDPAAARARFERIAQGASPLSSWAAVEAARRSWESDPAAARALVAPLLADGATDPRWPGLDEARAIDALGLARLAITAESAEATRASADADDADAEVATTASTEAERALRDAMRASLPLPLDRALARLLGDLLARRPDSTARREAIGLYLDLLASAPRARAAEGLEGALDALLASFPEDERAMLRTPSLAQERAHAAYLESSQQHRLASEEHIRIAARLEPGSVERCAALLESGRALHRGRVNGPAIERLDAMIGECAPALARAVDEHVAEAREIDARRDALAWAHYALGRAALSSGEAPRAILHLEAIADVAPSHRLVDDGLVYAARARLERGEREQAHERLERALAQGGDMRGEARFQLAWDLRDGGHREEALEQLEQSLAEGTGESAEGIVGRAAYWRGRVLAELGRRDEALEGLEALVRARPLTYYAQLALARIAELDAARQLRVRAEVLAHRAPLAGSSITDAALIARS